MLCPIRLLITLSIHIAPQRFFEDPEFFELIRPERIREELDMNLAYPELL